MTETGAPPLLEIGGRFVPLRLRANRRARRLILRIDTDQEGVIVTLPDGVSKAKAVEFARARADWILAGLDKLGPRIPFRAGARLPYLGVDHLIRHAPEARLGVLREAGEIIVGGRVEHLTRRLGDWLRRQARAEIAPRARAMAARLDRTVGRIGVRDTRSRWGSCAPSGNLSFCWRLILAPEFVLDYVIAHEVAHLVHMNHGTEFWSAVGSLEVEAKQARAWLNREGESLRRYG